MLGQEVWGEVDIQFITNAFIVVEVRALCRPLEANFNFGNLVFMEVALCTGELSCWNIFWLPSSSDMKSLL